MDGSFPQRQSYFRETCVDAKVGCVGVCFGDRTMLAKVMKSERNVNCQH